MIEFIYERAPVIGLLFFFSVFTTVALWAFMPGRGRRIESYKYIPLSEEQDDLR